MSGCGVAIALGFFAFASVAEQSADAIARIKEYENRVGLRPTKNFRRQSNKEYAEYRCYFTGRLELPGSYDELRMKRGSKKGCRVDRDEYDVFFYPMEAAATGKAPVTASLAQATPERMTMVVIHEDLHQHHEESTLPASVTEAASTLMSLVLSAGLNKSPAPSEADLFLEKAHVINHHYKQMRQLYASVNTGNFHEHAALEQKQKLFDRLQAECRNLSGRPVSFDNCPGALNNAGLAFDYTYTRHYPILHKLYVASGRDASVTMQRVQNILAMPLRTDQQFEEAVNRAIGEML